MNNKKNENLEKIAFTMNLKQDLNQNIKRGTMKFARACFFLRETESGITQFFWMKKKMFCLLFCID